jgi:hypothetical protein
MQECRPVKVFIHAGVKLSVVQCPRHRKRKTTCSVFLMLVRLAV